MTTFKTFTCELENEACGACIGCQTRTIPGTDHFFGINPFETRLLEELPVYTRPRAVKTWKLRGIDVHKNAQFRADAVVHSMKKRSILPPMRTQASVNVNPDGVPEITLDRDEYLHSIFQNTVQARDASVWDSLEYLAEYTRRNPRHEVHAHKSLLGKYFKLASLDDAVVDMIEIYYVMLYQLVRARNTADRLVACVMYAKLTNQRLNKTQISVTMLIAALNYFCGTEEEMNVQASVMPDFATMREFLDKYEVIKQSPFFQKVYKFGMYGLALSLFKPLGVDMDLLKFDSVAQEAVRKQYHMSPDFVHCTLDTILFLCERGYQAYAVGSVMPMFHSAAKYQEWYDKAEKLIRQANFLSNPEVHGIDRFTFLADLKDAIECGHSMRKCALRKDEKLLITRMLSTLELTHDLEVTKRAAQKDRKTPLCMLLFGGSGIGKSMLQNVLFQHYGKMNKLNTQAEFRYIRNPTEEYWSGMNSTQWCIVLDDIGFMSPKLATMDPSLAEMLCIANNVPFVPAQAELSDKGRTPVRAELVLGSTNTEHLNLAAYFSCPLAVQRRFPWILDVRVKPEYQSDERPGMLDSNKVPALGDNEYPDLWTIVIKRVVPVGEERIGQMGKTEEVMTCPDMKTFLIWWNTIILNHNEVQEAVMAATKKMDQALLCTICSLPTTWCNCMATQSSEMTVMSTPLYMRVEPLTFVQWSATRTLRDRAVISFYLMMYWLFHLSLLSWFFNLIFGEWYMTKRVCASRHRYTLMRSILGYSGYRVQNAIGGGKKLAILAASVTTALVAYKASTKIKDAFWPIFVQGNVGTTPRVDVDKYDDAGRDPIPTKECRVRPSYEDPFPYCSDDLSQASLCAADTEMLMKHVEKATCVFHSRGDGKLRTVLATNVRGSVYMLNNHGIPQTCPFYLDIVCAPQGNMGTSMKQMLITDSMVLRIPDKDLAFIHLRARPPGTNLTKYMCKAGYTGKLEATYVGRSPIGEAWKRHIPVVKLETMTWKSHEYQVTGEVWRGNTPIPTVDGDCGAMLVSQTPVGPVILGIHVLGRDSRIGAMKVAQETVVMACDALEPLVVSRGTVQISAPSAQRAVGNLAVQSSVRRANRGVADVKGSFVGEFRQRGRTSVGVTYVSQFLKSWGYEVTRTAPDMSRTPWILALNDTTRPVVEMDNDVLNCARDMFIRETSGVDLSGVHVYPLHVAINGCVGLDYCDKMNRKSSAGAPYKKSKKHFMYFLDESVSTDMDAIDEIKDSVFSMIATYQRGERCHPVYCGHLKDEPVTFEKAVLGKTRVFTASSMAYTLVVRKYLLSVIVLMQNNRYVFETGPGIVPQGLEWEQVREHITQHGEERIVAGDYSKFDKRMPANVILAAFDVIYDICERAGYSPLDLKVVRGIAYDTAFPNVDFNGDLIEFFGSNPSGHPLTVIINGIVNSLYMRYCYLVLRPLNVTRTFKDLVALMTYGDDNIMGVSDQAPWFNHTAIQHVLALVDIGYTMADKEAASTPYIHIRDANFLKRTWKWDDDVGAYLAPLDRSSIEKMLMVCTRKKNISPKSHSIDVISTALREYFFYGRQEFEEKRAIFQAVVDSADLDLYVEDSTFPTWDELEHAFWEKSQHVFIKRPLGKRDALYAQLIVEPETTDHPTAGLATPQNDHLAPKIENKELDCEFERSSLARLNEPAGSLPVEEMSVQADVQDGGASMSHTQDTLTFHDASESNVGDYYAPPNAMTLRDQTEGHDLDKFFARPVRILNFTWAESDAAGIVRSYNPWQLFFTDPRVQYKLNNFAFVSCTLKLKIMINASPFYYGSMLCAYRPLTALNYNTIVNDAGTRYFIPYSQRPGVWLAPQRNEGAEMTLPFLYPANWLDAGSSADMATMGQLSFINYTTLQSANGVSSAGVTVSVYAWAENVKLSGPSLALATQGDEMDIQSDEYGQGPVSAVASAVADLAGRFTSAPRLGRFATATQIGARAIGSIASLFGFTNVPVIDNTSPMRPEAFPKFASSEIGYPVEKLTLDPKNELTLDNTVCGAGDEDELVISKIVQRESYLCTTGWSTTNAVDDILFSSPVAPCNMWDITNDTYPKVYLTPMAWVGAMFQNWRGDVIFRFRIVASKYHKGRLRISFDPSGQAGSNLINVAASNNVIFTEIVDLDTDAEVEFRVPYQQAFPFLLNQSLLSAPLWSTSLSPVYTSTATGRFNGNISVRVLTALTAPVATSSVAIQVFVRGAENLEFANPTTPPKGFTNFNVQSDEMTTDAQSNVLGKASSVPDGQYLVNFGEKIVSLRQVMRRTSLVGVSTPATSTGTDYCLVQKYFTKIPPFFGYDPNGIHTAKGLVTPATTYKFNFVQPHPINWILPAFAGFRGSTVWSFNVDSNSPVGHVRVNRLNSNSYPKSTGAIDANVTAIVKGTPSVNAAFFWNNTDAGGAGQCVTNQNTNAGVSALCPMYTRHKFVGTSADWATTPNVSDELNDMFVAEVLLNNNAGASTATTKIWSYCGIGTDFNVLFFVNVPVVTYIGTAMVPV